MKINQLSTQDLQSATINTLLMEYNLDLPEIFNQTQYTPTSAYPEIVAGYYTLRSLLKVANRFGDVQEANYFATKITQLDNDWYDITCGKMPLDDVEHTDPQTFDRVIEILENT